MVRAPWSKAEEIPAFSARVQESLQPLERLSTVFQHRVELGVRQDFTMMFKSIMRNLNLSPLYRIEYADDMFDLASVPWLTAMDSRLGFKVVSEMTLIESGWQELAEARRDYGMKIVKAKVWEARVVDGKMREVSVVRDLDAETAVQYLYFEKRQGLDHQADAKAEKLEVYEIEALKPKDKEAERDLRQLDRFMHYIANVHIIQCYKFANRVAFATSFMKGDAPIVIQSTQQPAGPKPQTPIPPAPQAEQQPAPPAAPPTPLNLRHQEDAEQQTIAGPVVS